MATIPSPIYQSTVDSKQRLYYKPQGSDTITQIANPDQLQSLAKQGLVEVGKPYLPYTPSAPNPSPSTTPTPGGDTPTTTQGQTEVSPGVFSSSKLTDFYNNEFQIMKPQFEAAQKQLAAASAGLSNLKAPDYQGTYNSKYTESVTPIDSKITDAMGRLNALDQNIASIEDATRAEIGGRASEATIQAEVAQRAKALQIQRASLVNELNGYNDQRKTALDSITQGLDFAQKSFQDQTGLLQTQQNLAKATVDAFSALVEKGNAASNQEVDNFRQLFSTLLTQAPDVLKNLTKEEVQQLQTGTIPYSVMSKIGDTINEQKLAKQPKIFGSGASGFWTLDESGKPVQLVPPTGGTGSGLTQAQRVQAAVKLMSADPASYPDITSALAAVDQLGGGGTGGGGGSGTPVNIGGFDISSYATDPNHEAAVSSILNNIGQFTNITQVDDYIKTAAPNSPITGAMISEASQKYGVPWEMLVAMMQQDSNLGTAGVGARTHNPGNVGNTDSGATKDYGSWQAGVDAVASWLASHRAKNTGQDFVGDYTRRAQTILSGKGKQAQDEAIRQVSSLIRQGNVSAADTYLQTLAYNNMDTTSKQSFDQNANAIANLDEASTIINDPGLSVGPYKALTEEKKPYALINRDPKYAQFRVFTDIGQAQLRRAFFGTAVTDSEQASAAGFLIRPDDDLTSIKTKLMQLPKVLQFANDAKIARTMGLPAPKLSDYVDLGALAGTSNNVSDVLSNLGY